MIPLTGRNRQQSSFTLAVQQSPPAPSSAIEGWPNLPDLAIDSAEFHADLPVSSLDDLSVPRMLHPRINANQQADIFLSDQMEDHLFTNDLSDLSAFADLDFDDMLAHAADEIAPSQLQQPNQRQSISQTEDHWTDSTSHMAASPCSATVAPQLISPIARLSQVC